MNGLNVARIDGGQGVDSGILPPTAAGIGIHSVQRHPIHDKQGFVASGDGTGPPDSDTDGPTRCPACLGDPHARAAALQGLVDAGYRHLLQRLLVNYGDRPRQVLLALGPIAYYYDLFQLSVILLQGYGQVRITLHRYRLGHVAGVAELQTRVFIGHTDLVAALKVRNYAGGGAHLPDGRSDQGQTFLILDQAANGEYGLTGQG